MYQTLFEKFIYMVDEEQNVLSWRVIDELNFSEVQAIVEKIKEIMEGLRKGRVKLLVDNRSMVDQKGYHIIFPNPINQEWIALQKWLLDYCSHVAVLCGTLMMKAQMDRLATTSGLEKVYRSFSHENPQKCAKQAYAYLKITDNPLIDQWTK